jgi:hypothetical protein
MRQEVSIMFHPMAVKMGTPKMAILAGQSSQPGLQLHTQPFRDMKAWSETAVRALAECPIVWCHKGVCIDNHWGQKALVGSTEKGPASTAPAQ